MTSPTPEEVEALARQFCIEMGYNPDQYMGINFSDDGAPYSVPRWRKYKLLAEQHICMARAYEKVMK